MMSKSDRFAILITDAVIALVTGSFTATIALIAGSVLGHPSPLLLAWEVGGVVVVVTVCVLLFCQGARARGD